MLGPSYGFVKQAVVVAAAAAFLALSIALVVQSVKLERLRRAEQAAIVAAQDAALEAQGWKRTAQASQAELARVVPALAEQTAAAKKAEALLALASHWTGHGSAVAVPCPPNMGPPTSGADAPATTPPGTASADPLVYVTPHVRIDDAIALDNAGGVYVTRKVATRLSIGETWTNGWQPVTPDVAADDPNETAFAKELGTAWRLYKTPPYSLEVFVGPSVGGDGIGVNGGVVGGRGRLGWYASADYVVADPAASRLSGGVRLRLR